MPKKRTRRRRNIRLPEVKFTAAPDTHIFLVESHLAAWMTEQLHKDYKERIAGKVA